MGCGYSALQYKDDEEYFFKAGNTIKNSGKRIEGTDATAYGAIVIDSSKPNIHRWVFKMSSGGGTFIIGIDDASMKCQLDKPFTPQETHPNYGYFNGNVQNGEICSYNVQNNTIYGKAYAQSNHTNDTILMELDLLSSTLKYYLNDVSQGMACRNIKKGNDIKYRMAVYMTKGKNDAIIEVFSYSSTPVSYSVPVPQIEEKLDPNDKGNECFYKSNSSTLILNDASYIVSNPSSSPNTSIYGSIVTSYFDKDCNEIYKWKFKINGEGKCGFGIIECLDNDKDNIPGLDDNYDDFFYNKISLNNYGITSNSKCSSCVHQQYGNVFGQNDIIQIILDYDGGYLSFSINDNVQGNAYKIKKDCSYRMALCLYPDSEVELLSYHCIK